MSRMTFAVLKQKAENINPTMQKPLYAVSYEGNEGGGVDKLFGNFIDAVYHAIKLFGALLPCEKDRDRFLEVCADPEFLARVDVYECKDIDDACAKFFDASFIWLFHLDNDMYYRG